MTIMGEIYRAFRVQRVSNQASLGESAVTLMRRHRTRYGGYIVHFGVVVVTVGITASMAHKVEKEFTLGNKESYKIGRFELVLDELRDGGNKNYSALVAKVNVKLAATGEEVAVLEPEMRRYLKSDETTSEVALKIGPREDLYLVIAGVDEGGTRASFKVFINPLQMWLWVGAIIMVCGTGIILLPNRRAATVQASELSRDKAVV